MVERDEDGQDLKLRESSHRNTHKQGDEMKFPIYSMLVVSFLVGVVAFGIGAYVGKKMEDDYQRELGVRDGKWQILKVLKTEFSPETPVPDKEKHIIGYKDMSVYLVTENGVKTLRIK